MERNQENMKIHLESLFPYREGEDLRDYSEHACQPVNPETNNRLSTRLVHWIKENIGQGGYESFLINYAWPNVETVESRLMVRLWLNGSDREKGQNARKLMKAGKALKHLFPFLSDQDLERLVDKMRLDLGERVYVLKTGESCEDFKHAYTHTQCKMENPNVTHNRKSLANSCMRYTNIMHHDTDNKLRHPVESYASDEFRMVWVEDNRGHIAARCVLWLNNGACPIPAPIYGVCEKSINMIEDYLESLNCSHCEDWTGANLLNISGEHGGYIAPYLDLSPRALSDNGEFLSIERYGEIDASNYSGLLGEGNLCTCQNCGDRYNSEEEGGIVDDMSVCESCREDAYYCEYMEESTFQETREVFVSDRRRYGDYLTQYWCESAICDNATNIDGELWCNDAISQDYEGDSISPRQIDNGDYFMSDWDGEYYPSDMMCETSEGETVSRVELDQDSGIWELNNQGVWHNVQLELEGV